ncbi:hypothetical protein Peur_045831 [Populus x canadensis]
MWRNKISHTFTNGQYDYLLYGRLFKYFTDNHLPLQAKQLHARLLLSSSTLDNYLGARLINLYSKTKHIHHARHVFDQIPHKNTFSYNALLIAYTMNNHHKETINLFSSLLLSSSGDLQPNNYSITCLLKSLSSLLMVTDVCLGKEIHCFVLRRGLVEDVFVENALISFYSKCLGVGFARKLFDKMRERDVVTWNSMIAGYAQAGFFKECKELYREMVALPGFKPNAVTVLSVLQACMQSQDLVFGMEVHRYIVDNKVELDVLVCNALIGLYARCGSLDYARELFDEMSEKDEVTYGAIISGYMAHGVVDKGMELFREMKSRVLSTWNAVISGLVQNNRHEGVVDLVREMQGLGFRPNAVTLSSVLPTLSYFSNLKGGKEIHGYAVKNGYDRNIYVATAIIDTYAKLGFLFGAQYVFDQSKERSLIIWTAIISAHAAHGDANSALTFFDEMLSNGIQPDHVTFTAVLAACAHCGMVDKAWEIFNSMSKKYGIQPLGEHYACMVGVLGRAGRLYQATEFISTMSIEPNAKVWGALLHGASLCVDVELGKFACDHLFEIEPENTGNYAIMANLYSQAGKWKEADEDTSNENALEIYAMLGGFSGLMKEEGNVLEDDLEKVAVYG